MSEEQSRRIAHRCMTDFWGRGDTSVADEIFADDCAFRVPGAPPMGHGPQAAKDFMALVRSAFSDFDTIVDRVITEGDVTVVYGWGHGTHSGVLLGAAPTGGKVTMKGVLTLRIRGGWIVDYQADWDTAAFVKQTGIVF